MDPQLLRNSVTKDPEIRHGKNTEAGADNY